jgi:hypothetical protein
VSVVELLEAVCELEEDFWLEVVVIGAAAWDWVVFDIFDIALSILVLLTHQFRISHLAIA